MCWRQVCAKSRKVSISTKPYQTMRISAFASALHILGNCYFRNSSLLRISNFWFFKVAHNDADFRIDKKLDKECTNKECYWIMNNFISSGWILNVIGQWRSEIWPFKTGHFSVQFSKRGTIWKLSWSSWPNPVDRINRKPDDRINIKNWPWTQKAKYHKTESTGLNLMFSPIYM